MTNLTQWGRSPSTRTLQRDLEDVLEDFSMPRSFRREIEQLFADDLSPRSFWREVDRLMDEFESPPSLRNRIGRLFERARGYLPFGRGRTSFVPSVELVEQDKEYVLRVDVPGMREQDIDLRVDDDNVLTIRGERQEERAKTGRGYEYSERSYGSFARSVSLPSGVDTGNIDADLRNGVLEIRIPKTHATTTQRIPVGRGEEPRVMPAGGNGPTVQAKAPSS